MQYRRLAAMQVVDGVAGMAIDPHVIEAIRGRIRSGYGPGKDQDQFSLLIEWSPDDYPMEVGCRYNYDLQAWVWFWSHGGGAADGLGEAQGSIPFLTAQDAFDAAMVTAATLVGVTVWGIS